MTNSIVGQMESDKIGHLADAWNFKNMLSLRSLEKLLNSAYELLCSFFSQCWSHLGQSHSNEVLWIWNLDVIRHWQIKHPLRDNAICFYKLIVPLLDIIRILLRKYPKSIELGLNKCIKSAKLLASCADLAWFIFDLPIENLVSLFKIFIL